MLQLTIIGHLGGEAVVNEVSGKKVINFSVAHSESYKDAQGQKNTRTTWVKCSLWRDAGASTEIARYLLKGTQVMVQGVPTVNVYTNNQNITVGEIKLKVQTVELLGKAENNQTNTQAPGANTPAASNFTNAQPQQNTTDAGTANPPADLFVDDLPF